MKRRLFLATAAALSLAPMAALAQADHANYSGAKAPDTGGVDPKTDPRVTAVTSTLACNCGTCPHEPVNTCTCGTAARLRAEVAAFISQGMDSPQARVAMIEKYGYDIVAAPPFGGLNLLAWVGPFVLIGLVAGGLWFKLRDWKKVSASNAAENPIKTAQEPGAPVDPYMARIEAELERGGR